jgi:ABC-type antimicrobial peptide transport system permease subunit
VNYFEQLRAKVAALPEVAATGISTNATPPASGFSQHFEMLGKPSSVEQKASLHFIGPGYFDTLQMPVLQGRIWQPSEVSRGALLVLVNQAFVKRYFPNGDILGHSVKISSLKSEPPYTLTAPGSDSWLQIIGVVHDALNNGLDKPVDPAIFIPYSISIWMYTQILVRSRVEPQSILHSIRQQIAAVNPDQQAGGQADDLETWIKNEPGFARGRLISTLFAAFSVVALVLAIVGLYSVVSYSVVQRTNEFGIRMALGAQKADVLKIVLASAGISVGLGIGAGLALSLGLNRVLTHWVVNGTHNLLVMVAVSLLLLASAVLACIVPARRASEVDPMTALRCE